MGWSKQKKISIKNKDKQIPDKSAVSVMGHSPGQQRLPRPRRPVQQHALGLRDAKGVEQLGVLHRQLYHLGVQTKHTIIASFYSFYLARSSGDRESIKITINLYYYLYL